MNGLWMTSYIALWLVVAVVNYRYHCLRCHHEEDVPEVVIDGFAASANPALQPGEMPRLVCPNCGGPFRAADGDTPRERSER